MDFDNNLGFFRDLFRWERAVLNGQNGSYRLYNITALSFFEGFAAGATFAVIDICLISGKIDIHQEHKNLVTYSFKPKLMANCTTCSNTGQIAIGYDEPEWDNCPDCTPRKGVR